MEEHNKKLVEQARALEEQARQTEQIFLRQNQEKNELINMTNKEKYVWFSQFKVVCCFLTSFLTF